VSCTTYFAGNTVVHRLDPRSRIVGTLAFAFLVAAAGRFLVLWLGLGAGVALSLLARLPLKPVTKRLVRINIFMAIVFILVPLTTPGPAAFTILSLPFSRAGLALAASITLKANAIVLVFTSLLGTVELSSLGHAFQHLRFPSKLVHLFLFTLRYLDLLHHEYLAMLCAMKARAFRPRMNMHTYRSYGYLAAMLLVRSLRRSERVMAAMKCRGFKGEFHAYRRFLFVRRDAVFCCLALAALVSFAAIEWGGGGPR